MVVVGIVERQQVGRRLGRGRAEVGRPANAKVPAVTLCERDGTKASQRSATGARQKRAAESSIDARAARVGKGKWVAFGGGGRTPVDDTSAGDASRRGERAYLASSVRARNVSEVVTRPRGSLATRSAMRERRASRRGATVALPESAGFPNMIDELRTLSPTKISRLALGIDFLSGRYPTFRNHGS